MHTHQDSARQNAGPPSAKAAATCDDPARNTAAALDEVLFGPPFILIDASNTAVATTLTLHQARRYLAEPGPAVSIVGTLHPDTVAVDVDPDDTSAPPEAGIAVIDDLVAWCDHHGLPWSRRASGRPGHGHLITKLPAPLRTEFHVVVRTSGRHHHVAATVRSSLRLLSAPHRHHLPAPFLDGTLSPTDLTAMPPTQNRRCRAKTRRWHGHTGAGSRSEGEFGDALARTRAGWSTDNAWRAANRPGSKAQELGPTAWRRYVWAPASTIVAAEQGVTEDEAWRRFRAASPRQAQQLGRAHWRDRRWSKAVVEAARDRPRRRAVRTTPSALSDRYPEATDPRRIDAVRAGLLQATRERIAEYPRLPRGVKPQTLLATLSALASAVAHRSGSLSIRHWAELARLDAKTVRRARDAAEQLGLIRRIHVYSGGPTDCDSWLPTGDAATAIRSTRGHAPTSQYTPTDRIYGHADPVRLRDTHQTERHLWQLRCERSAAQRNPQRPRQHLNADLAKNHREQTQNVAGVSVTTIERHFRTLDVILNRYMPADAVEVVSLDQCAPVLLETPGKGFMFSEPLAKTGSVDKAQIYGEIGLGYGPENAHGKITGITVAGCLMKFTSPRYPQLTVHDLGVTFVDGEAAVTDKATADALKQLPTEVGVRTAGGRPPKEASES